MINYSHDKGYRNYRMKENKKKSGTNFDLGTEEEKSKSRRT